MTGCPYKSGQNVSDIKLDWYKEYWVSTTKTINYSIDSLWEENGVSKKERIELINTTAPYVVAIIALAGGILTPILTNHYEKKNAK